MKKDLFRPFNKSTSVFMCYKKKGTFNLVFLSDWLFSVDLFIQEGKKWIDDLQNILEQVVMLTATIRHLSTAN